MQKVDHDLDVARRNDHERNKVDQEEMREVIGFHSPSDREEVMRDALYELVATRVMLQTVDDTLMSGGEWNIKLDIKASSNIYVQS